MAYTPLPAKSSGDVFSLTDYDRLKANFDASAPDAFTTKGDMFIGTGADAGARLAAGADDATLVADSSQTTGLAWQIQPAAAVYNSGAFTPDVSAWTSITFDSERIDTDAVHSTSTNTSRLTVPTGGDGLYLIGGTVEFPSTAGNGVTLGVRILLNGATTLAATKFTSAPSDTSILTVARAYQLAAGDYIELQAYTTASHNVNATGNYSPEFWMVWQRR